MTPRRTTTLLGALALAFAVLLGGPGRVQAQCSMCQQVVTQSPEVQHMGAELNKAILVLIAAPYLLVSILAAALLRPRIERTLRARLSRAPGLRAAARA